MIPVNEIKNMPEEMCRTTTSTQIKYYILEFLKKNAENAYSSAEILDALRGMELTLGKIGKAGVATALVYLKGNDTIHCKGCYYWWEKP